MGEISTQIDVDPTKVKEKFNVATEFDPFHFSFQFSLQPIQGGVVGTQRYLKSIFNIYPVFRYNI